jgi:hypothetical protein
LSQPFLGFTKKRIGYTLIVHTLEETEETGLFVMKLVVAVVDNGSDAAHGHPVPDSQVKLLFGVIKKGVLWRQQGSNVGLQGWYPVRIIPVDRPGKINELLECAAGIGGNDL